MVWLDGRPLGAMLNFSMAIKKAQPPKPKIRVRTCLRQWRDFRDMTLEEAADAAGMTVGNLSAMERGMQGYSHEGLSALARVYKTTVGQLLEVDPTKDGSIWPIWNSATARDRQKIVDIARTIVGEPKPDNDR